MKLRNLRGAMIHEIVEASTEKEVVTDAISKNLNLNFIQLRQTALAGVNLSGTRCVHGDFRQANLSGANLSRGFFRHGMFSRARLISANASSANLSLTDFSYANLREASFRHADVSWGILREASCIGTDFTDADLTGVDLKDVFFDGAHFHRTKIAQGIHINETPIRLRPNERKYATVIFDRHILIGCELRPIKVWKRLSDKKIKKLGGERGLKWWRSNRDRIFRKCEELERE